MKSEKIVVCGGGGFIGGHLVADLLRQGHTSIRSVDRKAVDQWYQHFPSVENLQLDLQGKEACEQALKEADVVYNLAADMGGMAFIENNRALCLLSALINTHLLMAARKAGAMLRNQKLSFTSLLRQQVDYTSFAALFDFLRERKARQ